MGGEEDTGKSLAVDKVAFDYINIIEEEGYLTESIKMAIVSELSQFDEVEVLGTGERLNRVNLLT